MSGLLINRNYAIFTVGSFLSATGSWIQGVALGWLVLELGDSAFLLGLVGFARMVPLLVLAFPAGALGDRHDRRRMMLFSNTAGVAVGAVLAAVVVAGAVSIPLIVGLALAAGIADAFAWPVWSIFIKDLVGPERLRTAVAVNSTRFNLTRIIGPVIGGFLIAGYGVELCFVIAALSSLGITAALLLIRLPPYERRERGPWLPALGEGLRYASGQAEVRRLLIITAGLGLFGLPYQQLLPAIARDGLGTGPEGLGLLTAAVGVGAIVGAILSGTVLVQRHAGLIVVWLPVGLGAAMLLLALTPVLGGVPLAAFAFGVVGLCSIAYMSIGSATLQLMVREDVVGRVMGLWTVVQAGMMPLGSLALGGAADAAGLSAALVIAGVGAAGIALAFGRRPLGLTASPASERYERRADAEQQQSGGQVGRALEVHRPARQAD